MYYDRTVPAPLLELFRRDGPLAWIIEKVRGRWGEDNLAHVQLRRAKGEYGGVQLYLGGTSPMSVRGRRRGQVELAADAFYRELSPNLFGRRLSSSDLSGLRGQLEAHLDEAVAAIRRKPKTSGHYLGGEAAVHAGLMRRHGQDRRAGDPFLVVDCEVRLGFGSKAEHGDLEPGELDAIGFLPDGSIALVELKDARGDLGRAVVQVAGHVAAFRRLMAQDGYSLSATLGRMAEQKGSVGLLDAQMLRSTQQKLVPVIAAPEQRDGWLARWAAETEATRATRADLLDGLRFWRLSPSGELLEDRAP